MIDESKMLSMTCWRFIEKKCPGARAAWARDVGLPENQFQMGISGKPFYCSATERDWFANPQSQRRQFKRDPATGVWSAVWAPP